MTVVIPTLNRAAALRDTVVDLLAQDCDDFELVVVDQSDEPDAAVLALLATSPVPSRYFHSRFRGLPQARNFGLEVARGDIILYLDDDIRAGPDLLSCHLRAHRETGAGVVAGGIDEARGNRESGSPPGSFDWWTATPIRNFSKHVAGWCLHPPGGNFSVRRDILAQAGGVDEALAVGAALYEETELALRLKRQGVRVWFEPKARILHLAAPAGGTRVQNDWPKYMYGLAHNRTLLICRHVPWAYWFTAFGRLLLLALSYSRLDRSVAPLRSALRGMRDGRRQALAAPTISHHPADECTSS